MIGNAPAVRNSPMPACLVIGSLSARQWPTQHYRAALATTTDGKRAAAPIEHLQTHCAASPDSRNSSESSPPFTCATEPSGGGFNTEREPLAWISKPATGNTHDFPQKVGTTRAVQAWKTGIGQAARNAGIAAADLNSVVHDAGKGSDASSARLAMRSNLDRNPPRIRPPQTDIQHGSPTQRHGHTQRIDRRRARHRPDQSLRRQRTRRWHDRSGAPGRSRRPAAVEAHTDRSRQGLVPRTRRQQCLPAMVGTSARYELRHARLFMVMHTGAANRFVRT